MKEDLCFGVHAVEARLSSKTGAQKLYYSRSDKNKRLDKILSMAQKRHISVEEVTRLQLDKMTSGGNHQGVAAIAVKAKAHHETELKEMLAGKENALVLLLDGITDPHNLGACLRSADAFGVTAVIIPRDNSCSMTATVAKVACGAAETVPLVQVTNLARAMRDLQEDGFWLTGLSGDEKETIEQMDFSGRVGIVMGAEGEGMRRLTKENCDHLAKIPMCGTVESLNVSVATGVVLYEVLRSRSK